MLKSEVIEEINKFKDPDVVARTLAAAEVVAERLNAHTNRLQMVRDVKLIATLVANTELQEASHVCACHGGPAIYKVGPMSLSDAEKELAMAIEQLSAAKNAVVVFLNDRLTPFLLPREGEPCVKAIGARAASVSVSPMARTLLAITDTLAQLTAELNCSLDDANERLLV